MITLVVWSLITPPRAHRLADIQARSYLTELATPPRAPRLVDIRVRFLDSQTEPY